MDDALMDRTPAVTIFDSALFAGLCVSHRAGKVAELPAATAEGGGAPREVVLDATSRLADLRMGMAARG
jgi:hypothetical protein